MRDLYELMTNNDAEALENNWMKKVNTKLKKTVKKNLKNRTRIVAMKNTKCRLDVTVIWCVVKLTGEEAAQLKMAHFTGYKWSYTRDWWSCISQ